MSKKASDKLTSLIDSEAPDAEVNIHVMLRDDLSQKDVEKVVKKLKDHAADKSSVESLSLSNMVFCTVPLNAVQSIVKLPEVVWVDLDSQASIEELIDPEP